jgi:UDP-GlcNAc3NAcA epimerase
MKSQVRVAIIAGVRPQYIKVAALQHCIKIFNKTHGNIIDAIYINTKQHYSPELSDLLIDELDVDFNYTIHHDSDDPFLIFLNTQKELFELLPKVKPIDYVMIIGDTNSSLAGALAATRLSLPVVHLEAGIRSKDLSSVEEVNRRVIDHISTLLFCINKSSITNLEREGIQDGVFWVGDPVCPFLKEISKRAAIFSIKDLPIGSFLLVTFHKTHNIDRVEVLQNLVKSLAQFHLPSIFVTHPKTRRAILESGIDLTNTHIKFVDSLRYREIIWLIKNCLFLLTDSGGLQKEAYYLEKRCVVRRDSLGWNVFINEGVHLQTGRTIESISTSLVEMEAKIEKEPFEQLKTDFFTRMDSLDYGLTVLCNYAGVSLR